MDTGTPSSSSCGITRTGPTGTKPERGQDVILHREMQRSSTGAWMQQFLLMSLVLLLRHLVPRPLMVSPQLPLWHLVPRLLLLRPLRYLRHWLSQLLLLRVLLHLRNLVLLSLAHLDRKNVTLLLSSA